MPALRSASRTVVTRTLVSLGAVAGLGVAFVAGTSYDGTDEAGPRHSPPAQRSGSDATPAAYTGSGLSLPKSCDELLKWYVERGLDLVGPYGWGGYPVAVYDSVEGAVPAPQAAGAGSDMARSPLAPAPVRSTNGETGTNVQEAGVDEPDVVKTDGRTLYRVQGSDLVVYDVSGAQVQRLGSLALPGAAGADSTELLLSGDTVVAFSPH